MRRLLIGLTAGVSLIEPGCAFYANIRSNLTYEPLYACTDRASHRRHVELGREAFRHMAASFPEERFSGEYRRGFVDGFADYLDYGGSGEPPPVPPPDFRLTGSITPAGLNAAEDWFAGFRHGAATAMASGLRRLVTLPVHMPPVPHPYNQPPYGRSSDHNPATPSMTPKPDNAEPLQPTPVSE